MLLFNSPPPKRIKYKFKKKLNKFSACYEKDQKKSKRCFRILEVIRCKII